MSLLTSVTSPIADLSKWHTFFFFFNDTATTEIYTLSLHDALPIRAHTTHHAKHHRPPRNRVCRRPCRGCVRSDRKSTRLNSSHVEISYAVFCLKKKKNKFTRTYFRNKTNKNCKR